MGNSGKKYIIFGAGRNGRYLRNKLPEDAVLYFADNDPQKVGTTYVDLPVISFEQLLEEAKEGIQVILTVDSEKMREQLKVNNITFFGIHGLENNYFMRPEVMAKADDDLMKRFLRDTSLWDSAFFKKSGNWFREEFFSEENRKYVDFVRNSSPEAITEYLESIYSVQTGIFEDELFENRPGMRLIANAIDKKINVHGGGINVCDLACGHGALIKELKRRGNQVVGVENSKSRVEAIRACGIPCYQADAEHIPCENQIFDVVVCQECLEHVADPFPVVREIKRILKMGGIVFCTVPYGKNCDYLTHVRQFSTSNLYSLFVTHGFKIINLIRIPYVNNSLIDDNLFLAAKVEKDDQTPQNKRVNKGDSL